jgi:hypothetical protein
MSTKREELEQRAKRAILEKALFDWKVATTASMAALLTTFDGLFNVVPYVPAWFWPILGTVGAGALFYITLTDPETGRQAVADLFRTDFEPNNLKSKNLQRKMNEALGYHARIAQVIEERGTDSMIADELRQTADQMNEWLTEMYNLAKRLDRYELEKAMFTQNRQTAQERLAQMEKQLQREDNPAVRREIENSIQTLRYQMKTLDSIEDTMQRAQLMLDNKITAMGTIYLQSTLAGAKEIDNGRAQRLRHEISEELQEMDDILVAMDEVYATSAPN